MRMDLQSKVQEERRGCQQELAELHHKLDDATGENDRLKRELTGAKLDLGEAKRAATAAAANPVQAAARPGVLTASGKKDGDLLRQIAEQVAELGGKNVDRKQVEIKAEHEKQLIQLERRFQKQLTEARRKNEQLVENLRQTYEEELEGLKATRTELHDRVQQLSTAVQLAEERLESSRKDAQAAHARVELQREHASVLTRQADLVSQFLRQLAPGQHALKDDLQNVTSQVVDLYHVPALERDAPRAAPTGWFGGFSGLGPEPPAPGAAEGRSASTYTPAPRFGSHR